MKIHFSKKEYRQLLDLVFLGDWMASGHLEDTESPYEELRNKIYSHAKDFGFDDLIVYDKTEDAYFETALFEDQGVLNVVEAYNQHVVEDGH